MNNFVPIEDAINPVIDRVSEFLFVYFYLSYVIDKILFDIK